MPGDRGESNRTLALIAGILAIAVVVVLVLWMQDRESQDLELRIEGDLSSIVTTETPSLETPSELKRMESRGSRLAARA